MAPRLQLHQILKGIVEHVYFQPPANVQMEFPCIVYQRDYGRTQFAGNLPYRYTKRYQLTVIDRNPDSNILDKVELLPMCLFSRYFAKDGLNHDVYNIYF